MYPQHGDATINDRLFLVCDGMGGHDSGEIASMTVCTAISKYLIENSSDNNFNDEILKKAIGTAYDYLDELDNGSEKKMGTTMTLLKFHSNGVTIAHIGDSRVYQIRPGEGIVFVTRDHSLVNDLLKTGELTPEEAINYKHKNVITRAMQPCLERRYNADIYNTDDIQAGDYFYLCSDGMLEETSDENIVNIFSLNISDKEKVELLYNTSKDNKDNHTAFIIKVEEVEDIPYLIENENDKEIQVDNHISSTITSDLQTISDNKLKYNKKYIIYNIILILSLTLLSFVTFSIIKKCTSNYQQTDTIIELPVNPVPDIKEDIKPKKEILKEKKIDEISNPGKDNVNIVGQTVEEPVKTNPVEGYSTNADIVENENIVQEEQSTAQKQPGMKEIFKNIKDKTNKDNFSSAYEAISNQ